MDRAHLEELLNDGLSLAEIGRRVRRHEATVAYWVHKHRLRANGHERHTPKGPLDRAELAKLVRLGLSTSQIAGSVGRTSSSVRHWLREYGLETQWSRRRRASHQGRRELRLTCARHGLTTFRLQARGGYRCARCMSDAVSRRRRRVKQLLVAEAGGACALCGYERCIAALSFHHLDPASKRFELSRRGVTRSIERARAEARKCVVLCANCHAEVEAGLATLTSQHRAAVQ
jgi:transposase